MDRFFKILLIAAVCAAIFFLIAFILSKILPGVKKENRSKNPSPRRQLYELLCSLTYKKNVLPRRNYPTLDKRGNVNGYFPADVCVITRGGLLMLSVCSAGGLINNNRADIWTSRKNDVTSEFLSPLDAAEERRYNMEAFIQKGGIPNVPVYSLTVLTDPGSSLLLPSDNVVPICDIDSVVSALSEKRTLDMPQQYALRKLLLSYGKTEKQVKELMK